MSNGDEAPAPSPKPAPAVPAPLRQIGLSYVQQGVAYTIVAAFVIALFLWMIYPPKVVDQVALAIINMLVGALITKFSTVVDFLFGNSQDNREKTNVQNDVMRSLAANAGTGNGAITDLAAFKAARAAAPAAAEAAAPAAATAALAERDHTVTS